ncbi:cytochrome b/b6 domain-containing protein [Sulfurimonas diazotrophicus]|uniref:Cytochrome b/b6 domain-containing protein n=1 Tax=Sulfurimonas diazotrophicus TaxID=3131939 RepID=A0ABZ3H9R5_9BACT
MKNSYIWSLPTRLFHGLLVLFILGAYLSAEEESWLLWHAAFGFAVGALLLFRIVWGFWGPEHSRFADFDLKLSSLKTYMLTLLNSHKTYAGHNPAASFAVIGIIAVTLLLVLTGLLTYGVQENRGLFAFLHGTFFKKMELFEELHELLGALLYLLIGAHIAGVFLDRLLHPSHGTLRSIVSGYKPIEGRSVKLTFFQKAIALLGIGLALATPVYLLTVRDNPLTATHTAAVDYRTEHPLFANECAACHTLYPPSLLPGRSWRRLMADLENHFGDDASLEAAETQNILAYLVANAAEHATSEAAFKLSASMSNMDIIAVTQTPFWKKTHRRIAADIFARDAVKGRANCKACHSDVERGLLEDTNITIPGERS